MPSTWFSIRDAKPAEPVEILIYDQIGKDWFGGDGVSSKEFAEALKGIDNKRQIRVCINSPGGNVWDGLAIYNMLRARKENVTCRVDGVAASIASIIALGGGKLEMPKNSLMMIHDPSGLVMGNAEDMREMADQLEKHADILAGIYAEKSGKSREKMRSLMRDETWFTGEEAQAMGLCDLALQPVQIAANFNFSAFRRVPAALAKTTNTPPQAAAGQHTPNKMQTEKILALLAKHGKSLTAEATEEQILAALSALVTDGKVQASEAETLRKPSKQIIVDEAAFRELEARTRLEAEARLTAEFRVLAVDRPYLKEGDWIPKIVKDPSLMDTVRAMPVMAGTNPVSFSTIENNGNSLIENYNKMEAGAERKRFALKHWHELENAFEQQRIQAISSLPVQEQLRRLQSPRADNTYNASLVTDRLADAFITTINNKLCALNAFSRDFGVDRLKPKATVQVPKATVGATTQSDATNFESGDSTTTAVSISVAQKSQSFHVTNDQLNKGHQLVTVAEKNAHAFANALSDVWTALITTANFGAATAIGAAATFDRDDLPQIYALAKNYGKKNLILDGGHLAYLLPRDKFQFRLGEEGAYNFDLICEQNRWTSAATNAVGFVCDPNAIAVASGLPTDLPASEFIELGTVSVESLGLTVQMCHWFSRAGRVHWMSYDVMFGAAAGDTTAGEVLTSA